MEEQNRYISLSALSDLIRGAIENHTGGEHWVVAEVGSIQVNYSGHCYMELTERVDGQQMPRAVCRAVIWANRFKMIASYFLHQTGSDIKAGMKLLVKCSATFHAVYGLSLVITDIDPTYTVGEVQRVRLQTIETLKREGVFDMNRELELAEVIQKIAIVSSATAAGYGDFMDELESSGYRFETVLYQAVMQGEGSERSIVEALEKIADDDLYDAVVIIRGGGSTSDLSCFDGYNLCSNIAQFPMPVITGIGHERDVSVADMVAALSLKTPTAVAGYLIKGVAEFILKIEEYERRIVNHSQQMVMNESRRLEKISVYLQKIVKEIIHTNSMSLFRAESTLGFGVRRVVDGQQARLAALRASVLGTASGIITGQEAVLVGRENNLMEAAHRLINSQKQRIEMVTLSVDSVNPRRILKMGYAIINNGLRSVNQVQEGTELRIELADGTVKAKVEEKWQKKN